MRFARLASGFALVLAFIQPVRCQQAPGAARISTDWWSLRPLARPAVPALGEADARWARTPVDAFIASKLQEKGLRPSPEADRRTLIRRLSFDLNGLPPAPGAVESYLSDPSADAYERMVERLLLSPRHGERWARHWMDAVHFAETHGHDQDRIRPNAWPYRDYLIRCFNEDRPYGRFVEEQIAADALWPGEPGLAVALGFLAAGPWDESSLRDIRDDSIDRQIGFYIDRDDMVSTVMSTFASATVHCARCHDHKFDPISQDDYYALQAVFAGVGRADRAYDADPAMRERREALRGHLAAIEKRDERALDALLDPALAEEIAAWERRLASAPVTWTPLDPLSYTSAGGATLAKLQDLSLLASGQRPDKDTYTITAAAGLKRITAVRLEVLPDDSLPKRGPGRQDNGNLHLTELRLSAAEAPAGGEGRPCALQNPTADFDQAGWTVRHSLDGNPATAWGIHPEVGRAHQAVYELKDDLSCGDGARLTFVLEQLHGAGHLVGRLRLSATAVPRPVRAGGLPDAIAAVLAAPPDRRSPAGRRDVAAHYLREKLERELDSLPRPSLVYAAASDFAPDGGHKPPGAPRPVHVLGRGDIHQPGALASPGALSCLAGLPARFDGSDPGGEKGRRAALARWMSSTGNPLTWRSIANRLWHHHFGRGIVDTPNDFGRMGARPSHPELLDWLAVELLERGGSLRALHRLIVASAVYRQSSAWDPSRAGVDEDNRLLWRMNRTRLDAEAVRDAVLAVSGRLDLAMGGPSARHFSLSPGIHVTPIIDYSGFDWDSPGAGRRSVYRFIFRTLPDPFMDALDCADASQLTAVRNVSITAPQALSMLNNHFILRQSEHFAARLEASGCDLDRRVAAAFTLALARTPSPGEAGEMKRYAAGHGLANLCRWLLNSNEFLFVD